MNRQWLLAPFLVLAVTMSARANADTIHYGDCPSGTLQVTLNAHGKASKISVLEALRAIGQYPMLSLTSDPEARRGRAVLEVSIVDWKLSQCSDDRDSGNDCGVKAGFESVQTQLRSLPGVEVSCKAINTKADAPSRASQGAVTGSN